MLRTPLVRKPALSLLISWLASAASAHAASVEIWPSERRANNTLYGYGGDWNCMLIAIYPEDHGKHRVELPAQFTGPLTLTVTLPAAVQFLGADLMWAGVTRDFPVEAVTQDNRACQRITLTLPADGLTQRLIRGPYYYFVYVWFACPRSLDATVAYEFRYADRQWAAGSSRLLTAGVIEPGRPLPRRFGFYPYGAYSDVPGHDFDHMADFYRRFGINGLEYHWYCGLPADQPTWYHLAMDANRRHGVKNIANMSPYSNKHGGAHGATRDEVMQRGGLVKAMDESASGLAGGAARADWQTVHRFFDMALWDWEPTGPQIWPGYDDPATITAFAHKQGLPEDLTPEQVERDHRDTYARFRMEQIARPLYAMRDTLNSVQPIPLRIEQGSGSSAHVDYDVYGNDFPALTPMIYQPSPLGYARDLLDMLANTKVPASRFWPDTTIGWTLVPVHRHTPREFLMDVMVTAAAGCGAMSHWPNIPYCDAVWYGIHEGLTRIAAVEDFYLDGRRAGGITLAGVPYREEKINLGARTLEQFAPDWRATLITFAHELGDETLLTLLNYHQAEDCFVRVTAPALQGRYLVSPEEGVFHVLDEAGTALVRVGKESVSLWRIAPHRARVAGLRRIEADEVQAQFVAARDAFLDSAAKSEIALGTVGDITVGYAEVPFGGQDRVALQVKTPSQTLSFGPSGGRVYGWQVPGMPPFIATDNMGTDGLIMDMLWLPSSARWSGDEVQEMALVACTNDGREARVTYEGSLRKGMSGVRLRKTFCVPAAGTELSVEVSFRNDRVDAEPLKLAYWSHNVLRAETTHYVGRTLTHETPRGETTILTAEGLPAELRPEVFMPECVIGETGPAYAEYLPQSHSGLIVRLPDNFMNVYRWSHYGKPMCGSEWMSRPISLGAGASATLRFSLTAVPETTPERLRAALSENQPPPTPAQANLLPVGFAKLNDAGLPVGWKVSTYGDHAADVRVTAAPDETGEMAVRMSLPAEATAQLDTDGPMALDPAGDYMLLVQVKVEDMHHIGHWYERPAGIRIYSYGMNDKHTWLAIHGEGSTNGWVTGVLPFPYSDQVRPDWAASRVLLRCYNMTGTVSFRSPMILRRPPGVDIRSGFTLADGIQIVGALQLRR